jgi:hypothetical protein
MVIGCETRDKIRIPDRLKKPGQLSVGSFYIPEQFDNRQHNSEPNDDGADNFILISQKIKKQEHQSTQQDDSK